MKKSAVSIFILLICLIHTAFSSYAGEEIRIISLVPSQTELLFHLGFGELVAGVSDYCNYPEEARKLPKIGALELNVELIMSLRPTILVDVNSMHKKYAPLFSQLGLNYINFTVTRLEELPKMAEELAQIIGKPEKGQEFAADWKNKTEIFNRSPLKSKPTVYFEIWDTPMQAAGNKSYIGDMIKVAGGENVLSKAIDFPIVNTETILKLNPDVIIIAYPLTEKASVALRPGWQSLRAIRNKQIHVLDQDLFIRPGPRNLDALQQLRKILASVRAE